MTKKIVLGEYTITIDYNDKTSELEINVFDELGGFIEGIQINDDEDEDNEDIEFNLN